MYLLNRDDNARATATRALTSAGANAAVWLHRKRACINFTEPRSQCKGDCNSRPDVSRRSISLNTHRNTARRPNSNALCKKPVQYQLMQFRHSVIINVYTKSTSNEIIDNVPIESDFRKFQFSYCFQSLHVNCRPNVTLESIGGFGLNLLNLPPPDPKSWIRHCLKLNLVDRYYKE